MKEYNTGYNFENSNNGNYKNKRHIPLTIALRIWLLNGLTIFGIIWSLLFLPVSWFLIPFADFFPKSFNDDDPVAIGIIIESNTEPGRVYPDDVYKCRYEYKLKDGRTYSRTGYYTGERKEPGEEIKISYKQNNPSRFRAVGFKNSLFGGFRLWNYVWPILLFIQVIGLIMFYHGTKEAIKQIYILKVGLLANGKLIEELAPVDKNFAKLTYEFTASDYKTYKVVIGSPFVKRVTDEGYEMLVYDPEKPEKAVLLDQLPKGIKNLFLRLV